MSKINEIFKKVSKAMSSDNYEQKPKVTPNETELASYKKKEYDANVKQELRHYRKKYNYFKPDDSEKIVTGGSTIISQRPNLIKSKNIFRR